MGRSRKSGRVAMAAATLAVAGSVALGAATIPGPDVGEGIPEFSAVDQTGSARDFSSLAGDRGLLLLFFRSADW